MKKNGSDVKKKIIKSGTANGGDIINDLILGVFFFFFCKTHQIVIMFSRCISRYTGDKFDI